MKEVNGMKFKFKKLLTAAAAVLLVVSMLCACNSEQGVTSTEEELNGMQSADKLGLSHEDDGSVTNGGTNAPVVTLTAGEKPYRSNGKWVSIKDANEVIYDLKVTSFNVGQWYHGVSNLDIYGAQEKVHPGILPEYVIGAYNAWMKAFPDYDSDVICAQEMSTIFMIDSKKDITLTAKEVLDDYFKEVHEFVGSTKSGAIPMYMGMLVPNASEYSLKNITTGHLCEGDPRYQRAYMKGYITVNGHDIAVYCVHLQPNSSGLGDATIRRQAYLEIIEMASKEEYAIVMGDMNPDTDAEKEFEIMRSAGFNMANAGEFGCFNTYEYSDSAYLDNIFTTNNIEIAYAEVEKAMVGGSDHYPISAYLVVKDEPHTCGGNFTVDSENYMEGWYQP